MCFLGNEVIYCGTVSGILLILSLNDLQLIKTLSNRHNYNHETESADGIYGQDVDEPNTITAIALNLNRFQLYGSYFNGGIAIWDIKNSDYMLLSVYYSDKSKEIMNNGSIHSLMYLNGFLYAGLGVGCIGVWNTQSTSILDEESGTNDDFGFEELESLKGHSESVTTLFCYQGRLIAGSSDKTITIRPFLL